MRNVENAPIFKSKCIQHPRRQRRNNFSSFLTRKQTQKSEENSENPQETQEIENLLLNKEYFLCLK